MGSLFPSHWSSTRMCRGLEHRCFVVWGVCVEVKIPSLWSSTHPCRGHQHRRFVVWGVCVQIKILSLWCITRLFDEPYDRCLVVRSALDADILGVGLLTESAVMKFWSRRIIGCTGVVDDGFATEYWYSATVRYLSSQSHSRMMRRCWQHNNGGSMHNQDRDGMVPHLLLTIYFNNSDGP
jgi:hypothetical protein